ncbi:hypothetical protein [Streptomyces sp. NPDC058583]|uniref:hypothetical protein n=1 Tax=unclassified Streptomyces TaxID=2593676 RepID=UPI00365D434D
MTLMPQRANLGDEFSDHIGRQTRDSAVADDHCTKRAPHHPAMIDHPRIEVSPLTAHELVGDALSGQVVRNGLASLRSLPCPELP